MAAHGRRILPQLIRQFNCGALSHPFPQKRGKGWGTDALFCCRVKRSRFRCELSDRSSRNPLTAPASETGGVPSCAASLAPPRGLCPRFFSHWPHFSRRNSSLDSLSTRKRHLFRLPRKHPRIITRSPRQQSPRPNQLRPLRPSRKRLRFRSLVPSGLLLPSFRPRRLAFPTGRPTTNLPRRQSSGTATACSFKPPTPAWTRF